LSTGAAIKPDESVKELQGGLEKITDFLSKAKEVDFCEMLPKEAAASLTSSLDTKLTTIGKLGGMLPWLVLYVSKGTADVAAEMVLGWLRIKESSGWLGKDLFKILDNAVQKNIKDQLDVALRPFTTTTQAIQDKSLKLVPVPAEAQQAYASCVRLVDTFYNDYYGKIVLENTKTTGKKTTTPDYSEACLAPYVAFVSLVAKDFLEDGKVFETGDLLEAAAPIVAATRSLESRSSVAKI
jgi:hypothetical protein